MMKLDEIPVTRVQEYWDRRPCNIHHSPKPVGTREYFDEVERRKYFVEPHIPPFAEFDRWEGKQVLEIGCGIGTDTINFARNGASVTAVELSERSLEMASRRAKAFDLDPQIEFLQGNAEELQSLLSPRHYDLIYSFGVIHHSPHPEEIVRQARKFAGPESTLKVMVYHRRSWKAFWILLRYGRGRSWRLKELLARHSEAETGCPITYTYSRSEAIRLVEGGGFRVTDVAVDHIFPYRISDYRQYRYVKVWYFRWMPRRLFRWLEQKIGWHLCLTAVPDS